MVVIVWRIKGNLDPCLPVLMGRDRDEDHREASSEYRGYPLKTEGSDESESECCQKARSTPSQLLLGETWGQGTTILHSI